MAELLGRAIYSDELVPAVQERERGAKLGTDAYAACHERSRSENFRALVWSSVFADYAQVILQQHAEKRVVSVWDK